MLQKGFTLQLAVFFIGLHSISTLYENSPCGHRQKGVCKSIYDCPSAMKELEDGIFPLHCGFTDEDEPIVCCMPNRGGIVTPDVKQPVGYPLDNPTSISSNMCKAYKKKACPQVKIFVVGGTEAKPKELPFMALIGYGEKEDIQWLCGGSLISPRYVLSAAHCTKSDSFGVAKFVRLGELDISTNNDTAQIEDYDIDLRIDHPGYRAPLVYNDIALFRVSREVNFGDFIKPICLPKSEDLINSRTVTAAGWGRTDFVGRSSPALLKVDLDFLSLDECSETARSNSRIPTGLNTRTMICAGKLEGGKDTCAGDSGGPLFLPPSPKQTGCFLHTQIGITSFGKQCALAGFPGVYTNLLDFVPWIESVLWHEDGRQPVMKWTDK